MIFDFRAARLASVVLTAAILVLGVGSPAFAERRPQMTPMELQAIQSREFTASKDDAFSAVMTVIQDLGYQVESADLQTGFITAASATENRTNVWDVLGGGRSSGQTKMTAFVQQLPNGRARIRLNFLNTRRTSSAYGQDSQNDRPILDPAVYNSAWERIDEALFVSSALAASPAPSPTTPPAVVPVNPTSFETPPAAAQVTENLEVETSVVPAAPQ